jgi:hypothetical protein
MGITLRIYWFMDFVLILYIIKTHFQNCICSHPQVERRGSIYLNDDRDKYSLYSGSSSNERLDIRTTWVMTKILVLTYDQVSSYDPNAGQGQNVYSLVQL